MDEDFFFCIEWKYFAKPIYILLRFSLLILIVHIEGSHSWTKPPGGVAVELAELALVNQVDQLTHQVDDVTTDQLMTTPYSL